jgi:hypothetical protein
MTTTTINTTKTESTFRMEYAVQVEIAAAPAAIWAKLTNATEFPKWNSTVTSIEGDIALGNKLKLKVPVAADRVFTPSVTTFEADRQMVWADGFAPMFRGERTFTLLPQDNGTTLFVMAEVFSGLMLPMIKGSLPDFRPVFDRYAADLKAAAEAT